MKANYFPQLVYGLFICLTACVSSDPSPGNNSSFVKFFGGAANNQAFALAETPDGGFVVVGSSDTLVQGVLRSSRMFIAKTDVDGNRVWQYPSLETSDTLFQPAEGTIEEARDVIINNRGNILVLGFKANLVEGGEFREVKFTLNELDQDGGCVRCGLEFDSLDLRVEGDFFLNQSAENGDILMLANTRREDSLSGDNTNSDIYFVKTTADYELITQNVLGLENQDDPAGRIIFSGTDFLWCGTAQRPTSSAMRISRLNQFGGIRWDFLYGNADLGENDLIDQTGIDIQPDSTGGQDGFIAVGTSNEGGGQNIFVQRILDNGEVRETGQIINLEGSQTVRSIAPTQDGGFILTGSNSLEGGNESDVLLLKLNPDLSVAEGFPKIFGVNDADRTDEGMLVRQSSLDQGFLIVATIDFRNNQIIGVFKTDASGNLQ